MVLMVMLLGLAPGKPGTQTVRWHLTPTAIILPEKLPDRKTAEGLL